MNASWGSLPQSIIILAGIGSSCDTKQLRSLAFERRPRRGSSGCLKQGYASIRSRSWSAPRAQVSDMTTRQATDSLTAMRLPAPVRIWQQDYRTGALANDCDMDSYNRGC